MDYILEDVEILLIFLRYDNILRVMFPFFWTFKDMHQLYLRTSAIYFYMVQQKNKS